MHQSLAGRSIYSSEPSASTYYYNCKYTYGVYCTISCSLHNSSLYAPYIPVLYLENRRVKNLMASVNGFLSTSISTSITSYPTQMDSDSGCYMSLNDESYV